MCVRGPYKTDVSNWSGEDSIPKLQQKSGRSNNVQLDGTAAPRTAVDTDPLRRYSLSVEPSAPNQKMRTAKRPNRIERIRGPNHHKVARAQVHLSDHLKRTRVVGNCFQCLCDAGQVFVPYYRCCPALGRSVNAHSAVTGILSDGSFGAFVPVRHLCDNHLTRQSFRTQFR